MENQSKTAPPSMENQSTPVSAFDILNRPITMCFADPPYVRYTDTLPNSTTYPAPSDLEAAQEVWLNAKLGQLNQMEAALSDVDKEAFGQLTLGEMRALATEFTGLIGRELSRIPITELQILGLRCFMLKKGYPLKAALPMLIFPEACETENGTPSGDHEEAELLELGSKEMAIDDNNANANP